MSPGLERQAIEDLGGPRAQTLRSALMALHNAGSADAQQPLMEAWGRFQQAGTGVPREMVNSGIEQEFLDALFFGSGFVATPELVQRVMAACTTDECRERVASTSRGIQAPIGINMLQGDNFGYGSIGGVYVHSRKQFETKLGQYPKGTEFLLGTNGGAVGWYYDRAIRDATESLQAAGMKIVERPKPAVR